ncbi:unnamed protein product [Meganyctiphanes norvegica]|uniref:CHK kinase-like domain-containing protein n=1 Tax=Meganyctiphanes norvegica TaxID=48144 RepID=A0AAV2QK75_MEGNR
MKSPRRRGEVTKEWVEYMLTDYENRRTPGNKVTVKTWNFSDATKKGDGYSGDLIKLEVQATVQNMGETFEKEYQHIIKFTSQDPIQLEFVKKWTTAKREFLIYSEVIEELNRFQANLTDNMYPICIPTTVFSRNNDKEHVIVMENMKTLGYENKPKSEFLNFNEAKIGLEQLARLHAISYVYNKTHNINEKYPEFDVPQLYIKMLSSGISQQIDMIVDFLKFQGESEHQNLINKIVSSKKEQIENSKKTFLTRDQSQILCLNHGDPWNNNILVKQSENDLKSDTSVYFIDWEGAHWNTSAYDVNYFLGGALTPEMRMKHLNELLQHYHEHFTEIVEKLDSPLSNWSYQHFKKEYDVVSYWGLMKGLMFSMIISEASKEWHLSNHNVTTNPVLKSIKKGFGKFMASMSMKPSVMEKFTDGMMKKVIDPVIKEMKSGENPELNERFLATILEGDKRGFFDLHT